MPLLAFGFICSNNINYRFFYFLTNHVKYAEDSNGRNTINPLEQKEIQTVTKLLIEYKT